MKSAESFTRSYLQHFKTRYGAVGDDHQSPQRVRGAFNMSEAQKYSSALREVPKVDQKQVGQFLSYWMGLEKWKSFQKAKQSNGQARSSSKGKRDSGIGIGKI